MSEGAPPPIRWIVSRRYDMTFFIGAMALTFGFLGIDELLAPAAPPQQQAA